MKFKVYSLGLLLTIFLISCSNTKQEAEAKIPEFDNKEASEQKKSVTAIIDSAGIINKLQGNWKESEYPFWAAHFKNTTVKLLKKEQKKSRHFVNSKFQKFVLLK